MPRETSSPGEFLEEAPEDRISLKLYVQPRSSRNRITGIHDGRLRLALTSPPVEGQANAQVIAFLAKLFRIPKKAISIASGEQGRAKRVEVKGLDAEAAWKCLKPYLSEVGKDNRA